MNLIREIVMMYSDNVVIMQHCLMSIYYLSHNNSRNYGMMSILDVQIYMDEDFSGVLSNFSVINSHDPGIQKRFHRIQEILGL